MTDTTDETTESFGEKVHEKVVRIIAELEGLLGLHSPIPGQVLYAAVQAGKIAPLGRTTDVAPGTSVTGLVQPVPEVDTTLAQPLPVTEEVPSVAPVTSPAIETIAPVVVAPVETETPVEGN